MRKRWNHLVAFLLIPCLVADPALSYPLSPTREREGVRGAISCALFEQQAFNLPIIADITPFLNRFKIRMSQAAARAAERIFRPLRPLPELAGGSARFHHDTWFPAPQPSFGDWLKRRLHFKKVGPGTARQGKVAAMIELEHLLKEGHSRNVDALRHLVRTLTEGAFVFEGLVHGSSRLVKVREVQTDRFWFLRLENKEPSSSFDLATRVQTRRSRSPFLQRHLPEIRLDPERNYVLTSAEGKTDLDRALARGLSSNAIRSIAGQAIELFAVLSVPDGTDSALWFWDIAQGHNYMVDFTEGADSPRLIFTDLGAEGLVTSDIVAQISEERLLSLLAYLHICLPREQRLITQNPPTLADFKRFFAPRLIAKDPSVSTLTPGQSVPDPPAALADQQAGAPAPDDADAKLGSPGKGRAEFSIRRTRKAGSTNSVPGDCVITRMFHKIRLS